MREYLTVLTNVTLAYVAMILYSGVLYLGYYAGEYLFGIIAGFVTMSITTILTLSTLILVINHDQK